MKRRKNLRGKETEGKRQRVCLSVKEKREGKKESKRKQKNS